MLISNDGKIIVATPTKCGSESLEKDVIKKYKLGKRISNLTKHGAICNMVVKKRILLVRHPLERFASTYHFIKKSTNNYEDISGLFEAARIDNINLFVERYLVAKKTVWTMQLEEYVQLFLPNRIYKLEHHGLEQILHEFGMDVEVPSHINSSGNTGFNRLKEFMNRKNYDNIIKLHKPSIKVLKYS